MPAAFVWKQIPGTGAQGSPRVFERVMQVGFLGRVALPEAMLERE